jgi:hypothetical protein
VSQYPAADPSFTTKQDGVDYPQAAHINDLQGEVTAIGSALRATLQHNLAATGGLSIAGGSTLTTVQAGASTVASLQVTGGSTFAGAVTFGAGLSFAGAVTLSSGAVVSTGVIRQDSLPMWNVFHSTHVAYGSGSSVGVIFDSHEFVRGNIEHSTAANSSRVTINTTGVYHVIVAGRADVPSGQAGRFYLNLNDTTALLQHRYVNNISNAKEWGLSFSGLVRIASTGYLTVVNVSSNGGSTVGSSSPQDAIRFSGYFVG